MIIKIVCQSLLCIILLSLGASLAQTMYQRELRPQEGWWSARRDSAGLVPDPQQTPTWPVQVYA